MKKYFGTDGIRAVAGSENMNFRLAFALGWALVNYCRARGLEPAIIVGRDSRQSGPELERAAASGIIAAGGQAKLAGVMPTPAVAYLVKKEKAGFGLVISASHNSYEYNGLKIFKADGTKLTDGEEATIEKLLNEELAVMPAENSPAAGFDNSAVNDYNKKYTEFLLSQVSPDEFKGLKIVLDCSNGATYKIAPEVFRNLGAEVIVLAAAPDGRNINSDCGSEHPENLQNLVPANKAGAGLAFDGDGDRLAAADEKGQRLSGDQLMYIFAKMLKEKGELKNDLVVSTVMSNIGFINGLKKLGIKHLMTDVGDRQVCAAASAAGAILGGEEAGHIIFLDRHTTGDGILSGLMLLKAMKHFDRPLSELAGEIFLSPKVLLNVKVKTKPELSGVPAVSQAIEEAEKSLGETGRVLVRYSGTEPLCRVMVEGHDEAEIKAWTEKIGEAVSRNLN